MKTKILLTLIILITIITGGAVYGQGGQDESRSYQEEPEKYRQEQELIPQHNDNSNANYSHDMGATDNKITPAKHKLLIKITYLEARGESLEGKTAVVRTILNRVESKDFPDSIEEVIYQPGQFQPAKYLQEAEVEEEYLEGIEEAIIAALSSEGEELYFVNPLLANKNSYSWMANNLTFIKRIGNHEFYK